MQLQRFTNFLIRHQWQALLLTFLITIVPMLVFPYVPLVLGFIFSSLITFGMVIAAFMTLVVGPASGALFMLAATLPFFIGISFNGHLNALPALEWVVISAAILSNLIAYALAVMLKRNTSFSVLLQIAALFGVLVVSIVHLVKPDIPAWWGKQLQASLTHAQTLMGPVKNSVVLSKDAQLQEIDMVNKYIANGSLMASILFAATMQLILARWWQAKIFQPGLLRRDLHHIHLSKLAGILFILSIGFVFLQNLVVIDVLPIINLLFCAAGLSVTHYLIFNMKSKTSLFWLVFIYFAFFLTMPLGLILMATLGLADVWIDFRKRLIQV